MRVTTFRERMNGIHKFGIGQLLIGHPRFVGDFDTLAGQAEPEQADADASSGLARTKRARGIRGAPEPSLTH